MTNRPDRKRLNKTITIFGRNPVLEALSDENLRIDRVHLADSNKPGGPILSITEHCQRRNIEIVYHGRKELSRISRNSRQDQGVAADVYCAKLSHFDEWLSNQVDASALKLIVLDGLTNPQNIGMSIRSCYAAGVDAILLAAKDPSALNPLIIKASAGTAFKAPIVHSADMVGALQALQQRQVALHCLAADAQLQLYDSSCPIQGAFVVGNETEGVSAAIRALCSRSIGIPMDNDVESLNAAVSASLVAFRICHQRKT